MNCKWLTAMFVFVLSASGLWLILRPAKPVIPAVITTAAERDAEKQRLLGEWNSARVVPILSDESDAVVRRIVSTAGQATPQAATPFSIGQLTPAQSDDLRFAVRGLLVAYAKGGADDLLAYMTDRHEAMDPDALKDLQTHIAKVVPGQTLAAATALSGPEAVRVFYRSVCKAPPGWQGVLKDEGDVSYWTTTQLPEPSAVGQHFSRQRDNTVFRDIITHRHQFRPTGISLIQLMKRDKSVLFADARVLVKYSEARFGEPSPHYIRFWFDPQTQKWHPQALVLVSTLDNSYPNIIF